MLKVNKQQEPDFLLEYKKKYTPKSWTDYNKDNIRNKIKENILVFEQEEYCPYCEKRIYTNDNGHIEHIKPRDLFPKEFQSYENILVPCNEKNSCGIYKKNNYDDKFINLAIDNPNDYFYYSIANGEIIPKSNDKNSNEYLRANYTIDTLNLNSYELKEAYQKSEYILKTILEKAPEDSKLAIENALNEQDKVIAAVNGFYAAKEAFFSAKQQLEEAKKELEVAKKSGDAALILSAEEKVKAAEDLKDELEGLKDAADSSKEEIKKLSKQAEKEIEKGMKQIEKANDKMEKVEEKEEKAIEGTKVAEEKLNEGAKKAEEKAKKEAEKLREANKKAEEKAREEAKRLEEKAKEEVKKAEEKAKKEQEKLREANKNAEEKSREEAKKDE